MAIRVSKVTLEVVGTEIRESFDVGHAERLLRLPNNGGWQLPSNSIYEFDKTYGIKLRRNTRNNKSSKA